MPDTETKPVDFNDPKQMMIRYMVSDLLLRDLFSDWVELHGGEEMVGETAETKKLYERAKVYFKTTSAFGDIK